MKKKISKLLPAALSAIKEAPELQEPIDREFQAYISGMGASIMQMGLLPTLAVFADQESGSAKEKSVLLKVLKKVLASDTSYSQSGQLTGNTSLFDFATQTLRNETERAELRKHLLDAIVATKLCIRTFKTTKP